MTISTLNELIKHDVIIKLNAAQAQFDDTDQQILDSKVTRSPHHAIQFLAIYAGLTEGQRQQAVQQLNKLNLNLNISDLITFKSRLDSLIAEELDWEKILNHNEHHQVLKFHFYISIQDNKEYLNAVKNKCPALHQALTKKNCMLKIIYNPVLTFTTSLVQNEVWKVPFDSWKLESKDKGFQLSPALQQRINAMKEDECVTIGNFRIKKGYGSLTKEIDLVIEEPYIFDDEKLLVRSGQYGIKNDLNLNNAGIYNAFLDLIDFYGVPRVELVSVQIENEAYFSQKGAFISQKQETKFREGCGPFSGYRDPVPTKIEIEQVTALFSGADIIAGFTNYRSRSKPAVNTAQDQEFNIQLFTKSKENTVVFLLPHRYMPSIAHTLTQQFANRIQPSSNYNPRLYKIPSSSSVDEQDHDLEIKRSNGCMIL